MKHIIAFLLAVLVLLAGTASAESWTLTELDVPEGEPLGVSPDGSTLVLRSDENLLILRNGKTKVIEPNYERGAADEYGHFFMLNKSLRYKFCFDGAGVIWSPDGRYFALTHWQDVMNYNNPIYDPILFDVEKGENFLLSTNDHRFGIGGSVLLAASFDETGKYFDYIRLGTHVDGRESFERCNIESGTRICLAELFPIQTYGKNGQGLNRLDEKRYLMIREAKNSYESSSLDLLEKTDSASEDEAWSETLYPFCRPVNTVRPYRLMTQPNTRYGLVWAIYERESPTATGMLFRIDLQNDFEGMDKCILIDSLQAKSAVLVSLSDDAMADRAKRFLAKGLSIINAALSPDGTRALLLVCDQTQQIYRLVILDMETLLLEWVDFSGSLNVYDHWVETTNATRNYRFNPGMQWVFNDQLLLYSEEEVRLYQLSKEE